VALPKWPTLTLRFRHAKAHSRFRTHCISIRNRSDSRKCLLRLCRGITDDTICKNSEIAYFNN